MAQISINLSCEKLKGSSDSIIIPRIAPSLYTLFVCVCGGDLLLWQTVLCSLIARGHVDEMNLIWKCYTIYGWRSFVQTGPNTLSLGWLYNCIYWGKGSRICIWTVVISVCRRALDACKIYELPMWNWLEWFIFFFCCLLLLLGRQELSPWRAIFPNVFTIFKVRDASSCFRFFLISPRCAINMKLSAADAHAALVDKICVCSLACLEHFSAFPVFVFIFISILIWICFGFVSYAVCCLFIDLSLAVCVCECLSDCFSLFPCWLIYTLRFGRPTWVMR